MTSCPSPDVTKPARRWAHGRALAVAFALAGVLELAAQEPSFYGLVRVVDGDTVVLESVGTVRLIGIDTPETVDPRKPVEYFGREASEHLRGILTGERVRLEFDQTRRDRYGRTLAYLYLADGRFVNREMVRDGYAHAYIKYPFKYMDDFVAVEREAREAGRGMWGREAQLR